MGLRCSVHDTCSNGRVLLHWNLDAAEPANVMSAHNSDKMPVQH
jgi:hypothetical protein